MAPTGLNFRPKGFLVNDHDDHGEIFHTKIIKGKRMDQRQFQFTDQDFSHFRELVSRHTGISLSESKRELVYGRLSRRLRALNISKFSEYRALLEKGEPEELEQFSNMITTNLTAFFREKHHFDILTRELPALKSGGTNARRLRIWSAGCSTGEEPYSIAMALRESIPNIDAWDVKILATDLDSNVLSQGKSGVYSEDRLSGVSAEQKRRWFLKGKGQNQGKVRVVPQIREMISFRQLNLMEPWPMKGQFDAIFCRNVVIYFDKPTQTRLFSRFAEKLESEGRLFVGHSETLCKVTDRFELLGKTVYKHAA